jgi:transcription elongation factor GreA
MEPEFVSLTTKEKLEAELHHLKTVERPNIVRQVGEAFDLGDLPENAEWDAARTAQAKNTGRILYLEDLLKRLIVIDTHMEKELITAQKKIELEAELVERKGVLRTEIGERVATARAHGDLSENAEYHAARAEQGKNESRIMEIEHILKYSEIVTRSGSGKVELGATVVIKKDGDTDTKTFMIVSDTEADISQNKISTSSPMGSMMVGKSASDTFTITTPRGEVSYTIISIE